MKRTLVTAAALALLAATAAGALQVTASDANPHSQPKEGDTA